MESVLPVKDFSRWPAPGAPFTNVFIHERGGRVDKLVERYKHRDVLAKGGVLPAHVSGATRRALES